MPGISAAAQMRMVNGSPLIQPSPVIPEAEALRRGYRGSSRKDGACNWIPAVRSARGNDEVPCASTRVRRLQPKILSGKVAP